MAPHTGFPHRPGKQNRPWTEVSRLWPGARLRRWFARSTGLTLSVAAVIFTAWAIASQTDPPPVQQATLSFGVLPPSAPADDQNPSPRFRARLPDPQGTPQGPRDGEAPDWQETQLHPGESLSQLLERFDLPARQALPLAHASEDVYPVEKLRAGHDVRLRIQDGRLQALEYDLDSNRYVRWQRQDDQLSAKLHRRPRIHQTRTAYGRIESSLFTAGERSGLSQRLTMELAQIFGWDIDFAHDLRRGDWFRVLYRVELRNGKRIADGPILAAQFYNRGQVHHAIRFTGPDGHSEYYTYEGRSVRKAFLRSPVQFNRITSGFSRERDHPILSRRRAHKGVDYAARPGTPVRATGDGRVVTRGQQGGYGRVVTLRHFNRFTTVYAHLSGFARGLREGDQVQQGETIGYVGQSGLATGPHLHYEFRMHGRHRDPLHVELPRAQPLPDDYRARFRNRRHHLLAWLATAGPQRLAAGPRGNDPS